MCHGCKYSNELQLLTMLLVFHTETPVIQKYPTRNTRKKCFQYTAIILRYKYLFKLNVSLHT